MQTFPVNALAEQFEVDRGTMLRALRFVAPDLVKQGNRPTWKTSTAARALEAHRRKRDGNDSSPDPELERLFAEFENGLSVLRKLPRLEDRRAAARALGPLISRVEAASRSLGRRSGNGDMADLVTDRIIMLMTRGFCEPCQWNSDEAFKAGVVSEDEDA